MMPPAFYLETSIWGSLARRQPHDRTQVVRRLLRLLDDERGNAVISEVVLTEIGQASPAEAKRLRREIQDADPTVYSITDSMRFLAHEYMDSNILPHTRDADAVHVAAATCLELDYLVSWNHRRMTRPMKRLQYESVNRIHGYRRTPFICNPFEACDELQS